MFCNQCQESLDNIACTDNGVCGKKADTANLEDLLTFVLKGIAVVSDAAGEAEQNTGRFLARGLDSCITNVNFDDASLVVLIKEAIRLRDELKAKYDVSGEHLHASVSWTPANDSEIMAKAESLKVGDHEDADIRSLRELIIYGLRGIGAYADEARVMGYEDESIYATLITLLAATTKDLSVDELVANVMQVGEISVTTMALLDKAHTETYGNPEATEVDIGVHDKPGILISGHDLRDLEMLLEQTEGSGIDVYTHGEMLPAHAYPKLKRFDHLVGNYGGAWWEQKREFESFNGPILLTTNCIVKPKESYKDRIFTTGVVRFEGVTHIDAAEDGSKDFSAMIEQARNCAAPSEIETGKLMTGFAHHQVLALADKIVDAVKSGAIKRFVVMAGCDGRQTSRNYYTTVAEDLPSDTVILTAGCAKYRYNKLDLGDIGGIPRLLDAGQCNDSYSLAIIALKLKEVFGLDDINDLPISYDIAWYEQKAIAVLLALLHLGIKGIRLGPTLPAFLSENVTNVLVEKFGLKPIGTPAEDIESMMAGV